MNQFYFFNQLLEISLAFIFRKFGILFLRSTQFWVAQELWGTVLSEELFHSSASRCRCWRLVLHSLGCSGTCAPFLWNQNNEFLVQFHLLSYVYFQTPLVAPESLPDTGTGYAGTSSPTQPLGVCVELKSASRSPHPLVGFFFGVSGDLSCQCTFHRATTVQYESYPIPWILENQRALILIKMSQLCFQNCLY